MAKIYQFPDKKHDRNNNVPTNSEIPDKELICNLIDTLVLTYEQRIDEMDAYKKKIAKENGCQLKGPRELIKKVKELQQLVGAYGISCNFFKFYTRKNLEVIYYNETSLIYIASPKDRSQGFTYTVGEFIAQYEGYPFTLDLDQALFNIFDKQIENLRITIDTLNNTQV